MIAAALALLVVLTLAVLWILQRTIRVAPSSPQSPVAWLDDAVWKTLREDRLMRRALVKEPQVVFADDSDRARAPHGGGGRAALALPRARSFYAHELARLRAQPSVRQAVWPICCGQLATLCYAQGRGTSLAEIEAVGPLDHAYLEEEIRGWGSPQSFAERGWGEILAQMRAGTHTGEGINIFHCRCCGAFYVASCAPNA